jgi:hypothetical protein
VVVISNPGSEDDINLQVRPIAMFPFSAGVYVGVSVQTVLRHRVLICVQVEAQEEQLADQPRPLHLLNGRPKKRAPLDSAASQDKDAASIAGAKGKTKGVVANR